MAGDINITMYGNLTADPDLKFTQSGAALANFTVVQNPRYQDRDGNWQDGEPVFMRCTAWRQLAENVANCNKGDRVLVVGQLRQRSWETDKGEKRSSFEVTAEDVGLSVKFHPATQNRAQRSQPTQPADDPWGPSPASEEAPF